ncbi:MAG: TIGR02710 family CRISPR-associated protein [Rhodospirillaceae bacterium]|nr:TIGR02710 family CRISPR-associated protein [Rhodospirillaceae bacterium]
MPRALLLTVGTGNLDEIETSLLAPLRKSIAEGTWDRVVLLPSTVTEEHSRRLRDGLADTAIETRPLPRPEDENDADACFAHFDAEIERLRREGFAADAITVDFTRGTKAMSAALVLAAVRHGLPRLRYITGARDRRGMVIAGTETIREISPDIALDRRRIDAAAGLVEKGAFAAALQVLPDPDAAGDGPARDEAARAALRAMRAIAAFLAAWDRLDYKAAAHHEPVPAEVLPSSWRGFRPDEAVTGWVARLAKMPDRNHHEAMGAWLRPLCVDLLANAERRVRQAQFEDALVRAYRVLELIGQARLFDHGIDSGRVPPDDPQVISLRQRLEKGEGDFGVGRDGRLTASREICARLLKEKGDSFAERLLTFASQAAELRPNARNVSVLVHGFEAQAPDDREQWRRLLDGLWGLLAEDRDAAALAQDRRLASFPAFG